MLRQSNQAAHKACGQATRSTQDRSSGISTEIRIAFESLEPRLLLSDYAALQRPTELQYWDSTQADNGYTLFGARGTTYLVDMEGKVAHTWPIGTNPHLLSNGDILDADNNNPSGFSGFKEVDWNGNTVWSYLETRSTYHPHHDFTRIFDPKLNAYTTLYIANEDLTYDQLVAAGANPNSTPSTGAQMDTIVEVDMSGTIVWEWSFFDHIVQDYSATKPNYVGTGKTVADYPNKLNINLPGHNLKDDWLHCNSLDYNQSLDQIVINSVQGEFYVIDHGNTIVAGDPTTSIAMAATSAGDFLYRFGDPARYGQGTTPSITGTTSSTGTKQLGGAHDIQWIPEGLSGAGNFLIFNNAEYLSETTAQSYVMEINPYLDASGNNTGYYVNPPSAGYNTITSPAVTDKSPKQISRQVVWDYSSLSNLTLYSQIGCSAQRLPNGNTLICADTDGYITEVTPAGKTVWDYIVPIADTGKAVLTLGDRLPMVNSIFRAYRYEAGYSAFSGHTLTASTTIAGRTTVANPYAGATNYEALQRATETQYWNPSTAYNGYTFFAAQGTSYLIDMQGRVAHTWATGTDSRLLDSGNLLDWATDSGGNTGLKELDWSGNTVWQYYETRSGYHPHGDFKRIYDPKLGAYATIYLANKDVTAAQCIAAGCNPASSTYEGAQVDTIVEVDMSGNIVWEWSFWDHAVQNVNAAKSNYVGSGKTLADYPGKINLNLTGRPVQSNWLDCNSLDYNQSLDQIVVNSRQGEFYIIDHGNTFLAGNPSGSITLAATSAGDFLYRFGDPARYSQGSAPAVGTNWETATVGNKQIGGSSNVQWIPAGLPGAGHLLVFNNNQYLFQRSPMSYVFEINPYLNSSGTDTGSYVNPPSAGYNTWTFATDLMNASQPLSRQVVWKYGSVGQHTLFSHLGSSAQRLSNGNTLICATTEGYMVEVDSSGNVVWEYINPVTNVGIVKAIGDNLPMTNATPRALRFASSFAGFQGHTLTSGATVAGITYPTISGTTCTPVAPTSSDAVWVTSQITDDGSISNATLTYSAGSGTGTTTTPFTETFGTTAVKPWTGSTGADNTWTITAATNPFELRTGANYVTSTTADGLEFKCSTVTSASIATPNTINVAGTSAYVEFYVQTVSQSTSDGWSFQTDPTGTGTSYVTRLSESGTSHSFTKFHYDLTDGELVSGLKLRFLFAGGGTGDAGRIDLDQIIASLTSGGLITKTVTMYDDGAHGDGTAGDHIYGGQIPAKALGTTVSYYVTATDNSGLTTSDPSAAPATTYSYTVQANQAPTDIAMSSSSVAENQSAGTTVGTLSTTDPNTGNTFTYTLASGTGGDDNASFAITGSELQTAASFNYETKSSYTIRIRSTDQGGLYVEKAFTISVTNVNEAPTDITLSASSVAENQPAGTTVGTLATTDPDSGNTFTYSLVSGTGGDDNASFAISGSTLQTTASFNYETKSSYTIRIRSTDQGGLYVEKAFAISVTDVNEAPVDIALSSSSVAEKQAIGTSVGTLSSIDPDSSNTFTYTLVSGTGGDDNASFAITGSTLQTAASFTYATKSSYTIRIRSTDQGGLYVEKVFTISVSANQPPTITGTTCTPTSPTASNAPWITSTITDDGSIASAVLTYSYAGSLTNAVLTETFGTTATPAGQNWTGTGDNTWIVVGTPNPFKLMTSANYTTSSTACGIQFNCSKTTSASITSAAINAAGTSAYIEFYIQTPTFVSGDGWAMQVDPTGTGSSFVTRLSGTTSVSSFTKYHYDLAAGELTSTMKLRFLFTGNGGTDAGRINLDQITVSVTSTGISTKTVTMYDDGVHGDGTAGDHVYGAQIPAMSTGTTVSYYATATDNIGQTTTDPSAAPGTKYSYTVTATPPTIATTARTPASVTSSSAVWVTSTVTDQGTLSAANLIYDAGLGTVTVSMYDDGLHQDGTAGDHVYGAQIPAQAAGTTVRYYISATNSSGLSAVDPVLEPTYKYSYTVGSAILDTPTVNLIPGGSFVMGDHFNYADPDHTTDELPLHTVSISTFSLGKFDITNREYCDYLNSALSQGLIQVTNGLVYGAGTATLYSETRQGQTALFPSLSAPYSGIVWNGSKFLMLSGQENMPAVGIRWEGAAAYCNWLSATQGYQSCYNLTTWACDFTKNGYRLPTEAEWEYAANGGNTNPYYEYPWGNDANTDGTYANTLGSGSPWAMSTDINQSGAVYPWTTPVGFYDGTLHLKSDFNWPGSMTSYQTSNAVNDYGLYDMGGNVWQWTNDWFAAGYYASSSSSNPTGPTTGDLMPDGIAYRNLRGGSYAQDAPKARVSNRDPAFYRQPLSTTYASIGFRVALASSSPIQPNATLTTLTTGLQFGEGPASDASGNVYFSDIQANKIFKWSTAGQLSTFKTDSGGANGLCFDQRGNLIACQGTNGQIVSISPLGVVTVLASQYNGKRFNEPNDLWIDPLGGIYFTDPVFFGTQVQDIQAVYYISPDRSTVTRVISDMVRPNGLIGTADGKILYVSDYSAGMTYKYTVNSDGTLTGKTLFAAIGSDGMEIDTAGNIYMTTSSQVVIYSSAGTQVGAISTPERPTNLCFGGTDKRTLFITTQQGLYSIDVASKGVTINGSPTITATARSVDNPAASDTVWVTSKVADDGLVSSVNLNYAFGGTGLPTTVLSETMGTTAVKPWTGATGSSNTWTVTGGSYFELNTTANYSTGGSCGLIYKGTSTNNALTSAMIATPSGLNASATTGYVEFYIETFTLDGTDGWTFQTDSTGTGSNYVTRLSELTGSSHGWQKYHYDLTSSELVSGLKLRFQFTGGGASDVDDRIFLDDITLTKTSGTMVVIPMVDDGLHGDGTAGDGRYGAQIPATSTGTTVCYHVSASDTTGLSSSDPATTPAYYSYVVGHGTVGLQLNELQANTTSFIATSDYPSATVGLLTNTSSAYPGYTIIDPMMGKTTYLIDNTGQVVHTWTSAYTPGRATYLLPNGHLIRAGSLGAASPFSTGGGEGGIIEERDWDGNLVWSYTFATTTAEQHHDFKVLPNGNVLMLVVEIKSYAECIAAGFNPSLLDSAITTGGIQTEALYEVQPVGATGGNIVWEWHVWDHLVQDYDATKSNYGVVAAHPELIDANGRCGSGTKIVQFWNHVNGIDYNAAFDQILISARNESEAWIIDHGTTTAQSASHSGGTRNKGGDLLYRWGNPQEYDAGTSANEVFYQQHNTTWIPDGYPGAGNILVFDNGDARPGGNATYVVEFTPPVDAYGNYTLNTGSAYGPTAATWTYKGTPPTSFYSSDVGGAQRLPNGNTLINNGQTGDAFEVNSAGQIVWFYQNPFTNSSALFQGDSLPADPQKSGGYLTAMFRCERYALDYAAFTGRTLTPSGTIEQYRDWIELRNSSTSILDLGGMYLTNDLSAPTKWQIPSGTSIAAGGYLIFYADGQTSSTTASGRHTGFTLAATGGSIGLFDTDGITRIDVVTYGAQAANFSYGRDPNATATWTAMATPSPAATNIEMTPTVTTAAAASPNPVTGTTSSLSVLGADADTGEGSLTYTWTVTTLPSGASTPTFSANGTNAAKSTTATFSKAGTYGFTVTITDPGNLTATSSIAVTVNQTVTSITVTPSSTSLNAAATQQFAATAFDQFGNMLSSQPTFTWSTTTGTITTNGLLTVPQTSSSGTVTATSETTSGASTVTSTDHAPTVTTAAVATPSPATGTTVNLWSLGADIDTSEGSLVYTWTATTLPSGASTPTFSTNGTNAAKSTTATFSKAGTYGFTVTISDPGGLSASSTVNVTVNQTITAIAVSPASVTIKTGETQQFTATAFDQFGNSLTAQPSFNWSTGAGSISASGLLTAPAVAGSGTVIATSGTTSGASSVTFTQSSSSIVGRHIFYNRSAWDGSNAAANASDDAAIATDKTALLPGGTASFANYTSYSLGINGVMIDIAHPAGTLSVSDFIFKAGNTTDPTTWAAATAPLSVTTRVGAGADGSDRVTIIWADNAIQKKWLQVTVLATVTTGLATNDVFYFGNAIGEGGDSTTNAIVNANDVIGARDNTHGPFNRAAINDAFDYNRDRLVNATDMILARDNQTSPFTALRLITAPATVIASGQSPMFLTTTSSASAVANSSPAAFVNTSTTVLATTVTQPASTGYSQVIMPAVASMDSSLLTLGQTLAVLSPVATEGGVNSKATQSLGTDLVSGPALQTLDMKSADKLLGVLPHV